LFSTDFELSLIFILTTSWAAAEKKNGKNAKSEEKSDEESITKK
jgi:hypothetical protein